MCGTGRMLETGASKNMPDPGMNPVTVARNRMRFLMVFDNKGKEKKDAI